VQRNKKLGKGDDKFSFFPKVAKKIRNKEGLELRTHFKIMMCIHVMMLMLEIFFYNLLLTMVLTELFYIWMCYYNYMTLNKCPMITYVIFVGLSLT